MASIGLRYNDNLFSVTDAARGNSQFQMRPEVNVPGNIDMAGSVFANYPYDINTLPKGGIVPNIIYDANPGFINVSEDENNNQNDMNLIESFQNFFTDPSKNTQRGLLSLALTGNPITGALSFFAPNIVQGLSDAGGGIINAFKNFADRRAGRLDITPDSAIMPGRQRGALEVADDYGSGADGGGRSQSEQSFSDSQSYGGGGSDDDMGADSFI